MKELSNKELLDIYKIVKDFIKSLQDRKEELNNDREDKWEYWNYKL